MAPSFFRFLAAASVASVSFGQAASLHHHYPLDAAGNDASETAPLAVSGNSVVFHASGGAAGGFVRLGGSDDYLVASQDAGSNFWLLGDHGTPKVFSLSLWIRQTAAQASAGSQAAFALSTGSSDANTRNTSFELLTRESAAGPGLRVRARQGNDASGEIVTNFNVSDGQWHHVAVIYHETGRLIYVDGVIRGESTVPVSIVTNPMKQFALGSFIREGLAIDDFTGDIDDLQVYEGRITAAEARQLHENPGRTLDDDPPPETPVALADRVDPLIGVAGNGACMPGPCLPHASIYPSPDTILEKPSGFTAGSNVVGFSQLHTQGTGGVPSYGNFLVSPRIGTGITEAEHASPIANVAARAYSYRADLTRWGIRSTVVPATHSAIYEFDFPASTDARLVFDVARKIGKTDALTSGSVTIDPVAGTISGGGTFDNNWNPAAYQAYFYAKVDVAPVSSGTWLGGTSNEGALTASTGTRQSLGGWLKFDATPSTKVRMKIAVSFTSVERAREWLEAEIPGWDLAALETQAKLAWEAKLAAIQAPGIGAEEARKFYTALFHGLVQPRDRTGDATDWPVDAPFWDDHYTVWDTWQTVFPLLSIIEPAIVAANVNSFGERQARHGRAETAFIQGKEFQVGQGGDEVDFVIADAHAKRIPGIDWAKAWEVLEFNAARRTDDYRNLGFVSYDGSAGEYSYRMKSGSGTLAFAYGDWCAAQVASGLGKASEAQALLARSGNWRNVWDTSLVDAGFGGFVRARNRNGTFRSTAATAGYNTDFYEGTCWVYSFNVPHERDAMIDLMGGRARFIQRLEYALAQNNDNYLDFTNEPSFQSVWLFSHCGRPYLSSYWADRLRQRFGDYSLPGDDDAGAMSSLYIFLTAGFFPIAGQDLYYLHGPRVPRLEFQTGGGSKFTVIAENAGGENLYVQSATLNGQPLSEPKIRHSDITGGGTLEFVMGPSPSAWGGGSDFAPDTRRELVLPARGPWVAGLNAPPIAAADTASPSWGGGADEAANTAIHSAFPEISLDQPGDSVALVATVEISGLSASPSSRADEFAWGLYNFNAQPGTNGWTGYFATNDSAGNAAPGHFWKKAAGNSRAYHSRDGGTSLATFNLARQVFTDGTYQLNLKLVRTAAGGLDYFAFLVRRSDGQLFASFTGSDPSPADFTFNRIGFRAGDALDADLIQIRDATVVAGRSSYAGRDLLIPAGAAFYLADNHFTARSVTNHGRFEASGGAFTSSGNFTNHGSVLLKGNAGFSVAGTTVNDGVFDVMTWSGTLPADFQNTGTLLDRQAVKIENIAVDDSVVSISLRGYKAHLYQLQKDRSGTLLGPWDDVGEPLAGLDAPLLFEVENNAETPRGFYRVRVDP